MVSVKNLFKRNQKSFAPGVDVTSNNLDRFGVTPSGIVLYEDIFATHSAIYRTQPSVRTVIDFLARNIAQINMKVYDRVGDNDRVELSTHPVTKLLNKPNPTTTRYRMMFGTVADLAIYDAAFWVKARTASGGLGLLRIPPEYMTVYGGSVPNAYQVWFPGGPKQFFDPSEVVHFHGYDPTSLVNGTSPMETLKNIIAEDVASSNNRRGFWRRGARMEGMILRPADAPELSKEGKDRFLADWEATFAGTANAGRTGLLEEGQTWESISFSPKEAEFIEGRKLTMAQVAREFHVPLPMVGLTDQSNFASIKEYHTMLYQETLPPWLTWIQEEIELQLFPEFGGLTNAYAEFQYMEKLRGSFEDQAAILSTSIGGPWLTINEGRARLNLPPVDGGDELVTPLNVVMGGGPQPAPNTPTDVPTTDNVPAPPKAFDIAEAKALAERSRDKYETAHEEVLTKFFTRQRDVIMSSSKAAPKFDTRRWNKELREDLTPLALETTTSAGKTAARRLGGDYDPDQTVNYLSENVRIAAENINANTSAAIKEAGSEGLGHVFEVALLSRAGQLAASRSTSLTNFATHEAARQTGKAKKVWIVTSDNSRHTDVDGESVPLNTPFSNGLQYPGDPAGDVDETAGCQCLLDFTSS